VSGTTDRALLHLRSTRDLRAEMLALAAELTNNEDRAQLIVRNPVISPETVREEWDRMLLAIAEHVRSRILLEIQIDHDSGPQKPRVSVASIPLARPNYRYEILRILLEADLSGEPPPSILKLIQDIGASQTPVRAALDELKSSGVVRASTRGLEVRAEDVSLETMARIRAMPPILRFGFERGANPKSPSRLLERAASLLGESYGRAWSMFALSGVAAAQHEAPTIDVAGIPRLDLVAIVGRAQKSMDASLMRMIDDGLELQQSVLEPAPVVVTLVRSRLGKVRQGPPPGPRYAARSDVLLALLDLGLREQSREYLRAVRS
jgi:hypothetical protein